MAGTRFTANQGGLEPGTHTHAWNGRTAGGSLLGEGSWNLGVWYRLPGAPAFVFRSTYARIWVDRTRPVLRMDADLPVLTNQRELVVTGAVADAVMHTFGSVDGWVLVNGEPADLAYRHPARLFRQNRELAFSHRAVLEEGDNTITIHAVDAAGNASADTFTYLVILDPVAQLEITDLTASHYRYNRTELVVAGVTEAGAIVTINGQEIPLCEEGLTFAHPVQLNHGTKVLVIEARDPAGNPTTLTRKITVQGNQGPPTLTPVR
ncbi:MAG: hypothetical protein AB1445_09745 [Bacillota bacterium]